MKQRHYALNDILISIIALLTMIISGTAVYSIDQFSRLRDFTLLALFLALGIYLIINIKIDRVKKGFLLVAAIFVLFFAVSCIAHFINTFNFLSKILMAILYVFLFYKTEAAKKTILFLYKAVVFLAGLSLCFFFLLYFLRLPLPYVSIHNGFYRSYFGLFTEADVYKQAVGPIVFHRLQGIFWEPGVFGVYLILGIFYNTFISGKKNNAELLLLITCLLLTLSTTGIILGLFVIAVLFLCQFKSKADRILVLLPLAFIVAFGGYYALMAKKNGGGGYSASYILRMVDLQASLEIWGKHFFFGTGYNNIEEFLEATREWERQNSNGFMNWCMTMGLWGVLVQMLPFVMNIIKSKSARKTANIVFAVVYIGINMTEPLITSPLMLMLLAFAYANMMKQKYGGLYADEPQRKKACISLS